MISGRIPPESIWLAETHPVLLVSDSIFFLLISSTMSEILIHNMPMGIERSPLRSYTVSSISLALSTSISWTSCSQRPVLVPFVRALKLSSTFTMTNVSGPRLNRPVAA